MKKNILICFLFTLPFLVKAQDTTFTVSGKIGNYHAPAQVFVSHVVNGVLVRDSAFLDHGTFKIKGIINDGFKQGTLLLNEFGVSNDKFLDSAARSPNPKNFVTIIYLEPGDIKVNSPDIIGNATITSPFLKPTYDKYVGLILERRKEDNKKWEALSAEQRKDPVLANKYKVEQEKLRAEYYEALFKGIEENKHNLFGFYGFSKMSLENEKYQKRAIALFNSFPEKQKNSQLGKNFLKNVDQTNAALKVERLTGVGVVAPDFTLNDEKGKPVKLSSLKGKYVLIDFWASWCGPCRRENPNVVASYNKYKDKNFTILGVSLDTDKEKWLGAIKEDNLPWGQVIDVKENGNSVGSLYGVTAIPMNFLIGPDGKIVDKNLRGRMLDLCLSNILK